MSTPSPSEPRRRPTTNGDSRRPSIARGETAPTRLMNGHFASVGEEGTREQYARGVQVIDQDKEFNTKLQQYLAVEKVLPVGFNYHLISVFGSQSTGKSTLLNYLFGTEFGVMNEQERRQTTKGIWMSKNKREEAGGMAENILVMDVEGTDGRERGEDQDFERKSSLFALATSEVLMVNIWEHQVGLYQGANMGLLKTVFEVNLQLFLKDNQNMPRSLLFFVIRDHTGQTPLENLRVTVMKDLMNIWSSISKPKGLENSKIEDYFDFAFVGLPHKVFALKEFEREVEKLSKRFRAGHKDPKRAGLLKDEDQGIFLPQYHRRIPADGFAVYAEGVWDQIVHNKDLDLPTQQELLAQFRCDEIMREVLIPFDEIIEPLEQKQAEGIRLGEPVIIPELGPSMNKARVEALRDFDTDASRYHKAVYQRKGAELAGKIDTRLKALSKGQLDAALKSGLDKFGEAVSSEVKAGQKKNATYDFAQIVEEQKKNALAYFERIAKTIVIQDASWSNYQQELTLFKKALDESSKRLRKDEMRRLATRVERWVRSRLSESIGLEFNKLGSGRGGSGAPEHGDKPASEGGLWDRIWKVFTKTVEQAEKRFSDRAQSFDATNEEVEVGLWRLRRKSWGVLRARVDEEMMEGNLLLKLRENFEDKFRYDADGVPRIWRPTDDIEGAYTKARESTLHLIPLLSRFKLSETGSPPPLDAWIGAAPQGVSAADEEDLVPIGGVDDEEGKSLEEETVVLTEAKAADLANRFRKMADGVFVEAKRGALGGVTQVPLWFYGLLLALGWNELVAVLRNPLYFIFLIMLAGGAYVTYTLNLWGPMYHMANAASTQGLDIAKDRLRQFLLETDTGRQAMAMSGREADDIKMSRLDGSGKKSIEDDDADDI